MVTPPSPRFPCDCLSRHRIAALGTRLAWFLGDLVGTLRGAGWLEIANGYDLDRELVHLAIRDACAADWASTRSRIRPRNVYQFAGFGPARLAAEACFESQTLAPFARHHALCDARALRIAYQAGLQGHRGLPANVPPEASARQPTPA